MSVKPLYQSLLDQILMKIFIRSWSNIFRRSCDVIRRRRSFIPFSVGKADVPAFWQLSKLIIPPSNTPQLSSWRCERSKQLLHISKGNPNTFKKQKKTYLEEDAPTLHLERHWWNRNMVFVCFRHEGTGQSKPAWWLAELKGQCGCRGTLVHSSSIYDIYFSTALWY